MPARTRRKAKSRGWLWRHRRGLFIASLCFFTLLAGAAYLLLRVPLPPEALQAQTTFLTDINGARLASLHPGEDRVVRDLDEMPRVLRQAVLAVEDRNYYEHGGVDLRGTLRALWTDIRGRSLSQGGSTITQQYVKNTYVGRERTLWRKVREAVLAIKVERKFDKDEILERYLNTIYFGRGAYGVEAASRAYFGKDVHLIGLKEAAYLAGLIQAPQLADALRDPETAAARRSSTLRAMRRAGMISPGDQADVEAVPLSDYVIDQHKLEPTVVLENKGTRYFVEHVRRELQREYGEKAVIGTGWRIKTTLDLRMQQQAYDAVYGILDRADDPAGALVAVDDTGQVKAMVGGRDWDESKVNLALGKLGGGAGRQAGSTFKPFLLAEIVRQGYTVESALPGPAKIVLPKANDGKDWEVSNYENADFGSQVNLIDATRNSVNTVYAQAVLAIGADRMKDMAEDLGVRSQLPAVNSLVLGTADVSPLDLAAAFSTFANRGERIAPRTVLEIRDADGNVIKKRSDPDRTRVLTTKEADVVNFALRQVVERGTGTTASWGRPGILIGKTGTTQDYGDALMVGATSKLTAAVWMGFPESRNHAMDNVRGRRVNGGSYPATMFRRFMQAVTRGMDLEPFPSVSSFPGKVLKGSRVPYVSATSSSSSSVPARSSTTRTVSVTTVPPPDPPEDTTPEPTSPPFDTRPPRRTTTTASTPPQFTTTTPP